MMALNEVSKVFWNPTIWLPPNISWVDIEPNDSNAYANPSDLLIPLPLAVLLLGLRYILEKYWFAPVGLSIGIKYSRNKKAHPNPVLERAYVVKGKIRHKQIVALARQVEWSERQVERWLRQRKSQDKPSTLTKFCETCWRWLYYTFSFCYGVICLWDKPWFWDINQCYQGYPFQSITNDCWWYYIFSLAFYWALTLSQFFDVKRKDFCQMFVHHVTTICLLSFSWMCNLHRIGTVVLLVHDCADVFLEAAKLAKYAQYQKICDTLFVTFTILWIVTRCGIYPFWIIYSTTVDAPTVLPMFPAYYIFNSLLVLLLGLHLFWTYVILKIAFTAIYAGQMEGDIRSSSSNDISEEMLNTYTPTCSPKRHKSK